jgi:hypothetical protein
LCLRSRFELNFSRNYVGDRGGHYFATIPLVSVSKDLVSSSVHPAKVQKKKRGARGPYNTKKKQAEAKEAATAVAAQKETADALQAAAAATVAAQKAAGDAMAMAAQLAAQLASAAPTPKAVAVQLVPQVAAAPVSCEQLQPAQNKRGTAKKASSKRERPETAEVEPASGEQKVCAVITCRVSWFICFSDCQHRAVGSARVPPASGQGGGEQGRVRKVDPLQRTDVRARRSAREVRGSDAARQSGARKGALVVPRVPRALIKR